MEARVEKNGLSRSHFYFSNAIKDVEEVYSCGQKKLYAVWYLEKGVSKWLVPTSLDKVISLCQDSSVLVHKIVLLTESWKDITF